MTSARRWRVLGLTVCVALAGVTGVAYYSGLQVEKAVNQQFTQPVTLANGVELAVTRFKRGVYRSNLDLQLSVPESPAQTLILSFTGEVDHGPFPLSQVAGFNLQPAMAAVGFKLVTAVRQTQRATEQLNLRLTGRVLALYSQALESTVHVDAGAFPIAGLAVTVSNGRVTLKRSSEQLRIALDINDTLLKADQQVSPYTLIIADLASHLTFNTRTKSGALGVAAMRMDYQMGGDTVVRLDAFEQQADFNAANGKLCIASSGGSALSLWDQPLGPVSQGLMLKDYPLTPSTTAKSGPLEPAGVLQANLIRIERPAGISAVTLSKEQGSAALNIDLQLSKPMFIDAVASNPKLAAQGQPLAQQQAQMMYAVVSGFLQQTGLTTLTPEGIEAALTADKSGIKRR